MRTSALRRARYSLLRMNNLRAAPELASAVRIISLHCVASVVEAGTGVSNAFAAVVVKEWH